MSRPRSLCVVALATSAAVGLVAPSAGAAAAPAPSTGATAATAAPAPAARAAAAPAPVDEGLLYRTTQTQTGSQFSGRIDAFRPDGSGLRTIVRTKRGSVLGHLRVSADGGTLAYVEATGLGTSRPRVAVKVVATTGGTPRTLDAGRFATQGLALSPDATTVYYAKLRPDSPTDITDADYKRSELYAVPVTGGTPRRLTRDQVDDYAPTTGPDGRLYWTRDAGGRSGADAWSMAADGTDRRRLDRSSVSTETRDVAADGRVLVSRTAADSRRSQLATTAPDGSQVAPIAPPIARGWPAAVWSPDAQRIAALRAYGPQRDGRYAVVRLNVATGNVTRVFAPRAGETAISVDWAPTPSTAGR